MCNKISCWEVPDPPSFWKHPISAIRWWFISQWERTRLYRWLLKRRLKHEVPRIIEILVECGRNSGGIGIPIDDLVSARPYTYSEKEELWWKWEKRNK